MDIDKKKLGKRIKSIRVAEKGTLEAFSNKINKQSGGVVKSGKSNVSRWERGENIPNDITLKAIADIANISVEELLYDNPNTKYSVDFEQTQNHKNYVDNKKNVFKQEVKLLTPATLSGLLTLGLGFKKSMADAITDYETHQKRIQALEKFGQKYIDVNYDNYTYEKYLQDFPNSNPQEFEKYKENEWIIFKELLDKFWEAFDIADKNYAWINSRFTDQIADELDEISKLATKEGKEHYYVNELVQPFLDQAAKEFKKHIKDNTDIE